MKYQKKGFSIILALGLSLLFVLTGLYLLEYIIPFSRSVKGIENASISSYQASSAIEDALYEIAQNNPGVEESKDFVIGSLQDYRFTMTASGTLLPLPGDGNSLDSDWNMISQTSPLQLLIGRGRISSGTPINNRLRIDFRIPDFDRNGSPDTLTNDPTQDLILWQISSNTDTYVAQTLFKAADITGGVISLIPLVGTANSGTFYADFNAFYTTNCGGTNECILRISLINSILGNNAVIYPFLEYQVSSISPIPFPITTLSITGKSYGYSKKMNVRVPQATTSSAFDFTIFQ